LSEIVFANASPRVKGHSDAHAKGEAGSVLFVASVDPNLDLARINQLQMDLRPRELRKQFVLTGKK